MCVRVVLCLCFYVYVCCVLCVLFFYFMYCILYFVFIDVCSLLLLCVVSSSMRNHVCCFVLFSSINTDVVSFLLLVRSDLLLHCIVV